MIDWQGFFDSRLTNTAAGDLRGAIISGSRAIVYATDDAIANDLANGIKNKLFAFLLGVYAHPELKVILCGEEYVICRMDDQPGSVVGERVEALLTVGEPAYLYARMIRNGTAVLLVLTDGTSEVSKDKLIGVVDKAVSGLVSA